MRDELRSITKHLKISNQLQHHQMSPKCLAIVIADVYMRNDVHVFHVHGYEQLHVTSSINHRNKVT